MKYQGKRVLVFGTSIEIPWIFPILSENGAYLFYINKKASSGTLKNYANEYADIDYHDIERTISYCKENKIDAAITDSVEEDIELCRIINEKIGNPFFYTEEQWNTFCIKDNFEKVCEKYGIRTAKKYFNGDINDFNNFNFINVKFPVVSKAVDSCGGRGCYKCNNIFELRLFAKHSFGNSLCKRIIVEEFLKGLEATLTFAIQNNECRLISATDRYVKYKKRFKNNVHSYFIAPSKFSDYFLNSQFDLFSKMFLDQKLNNCTIFVQGYFVDNNFIPLEASLRFEGTLTFINNIHFNNQDFRTLVFDNILKVKSDYDADKDSYKFNNRICLYYGNYLKKGLICSVKGVDEISNLDKCYNATIHRHIGQYVNTDNAITSVFSCFNFDCDNYNDARKYAKFVTKNLKVKTSRGRNLLIKPRKLF